jgi:hypothetical protein
MIVSTNYFYSYLWEFWLLPAYMQMRTLEGGLPIFFSKQTPVQHSGTTSWKPSLILNFLTSASQEPSPTPVQPLGLVHETGYWNPPLAMVCCPHKAGGSLRSDLETIHTNYPNSLRTSFIWLLKYAKLIAGWQKNFSNWKSKQFWNSL